MITEDKVTEIFCTAADFCNIFDAITNKNGTRHGKKARTAQQINRHIRLTGDTHRTCLDYYPCFYYKNFVSLFFILNFVVNNFHTLT